MGNPDEPGCFAYTPSNVDVTAYDFTSVPDATLDCGTTTVTTNALLSTVTFDNWCGGDPTYDVVTQNNGHALAVIPLKSLNVASGNTLRLLGDAPVAFVVDGDVTVAGTIDGHSSNSGAGAGADWQCGTSAGAPGGNDNLSSGGGGGGGFGTEGGKGGDGKVSGGAGGLVRTQPAGLSPLVGGCPGGQGGYDSSCSDNTGSGGGAVQISTAANLVFTGQINMQGEDGRSGCGSDGGGGGGGSGGGVLLEGIDVDLTGGAINASGGRGGSAAKSGGTGSTSSANPGNPGTADGALGGSGGGGGYGRVQVTATGTCTSCI